ncbi:MAG: VWA domain-containing protein, partial [Muribaculaceae bacterium]|nr:VWA domain-containing protein [Muribaculaceae bacterium]
VSRLQRAKHVLGRLIDNLENDRVGLIVFAGEAYTQLPLTPDFMSAKMYLNDISTGMVENQGTSIGAAIEVAMNSFSGATDVERAIVLITDAEDQIGDAENMAEVAHREGIEVDVIGLGSGKGAQIPLDNSYSNWLKDDEGRVVTTYLNEEMAHSIARAGGGIYINGASPSALNDLVKRLDEIKKSDLGTMTYTAADEQFPLFAALALMLIVLDCIFSNRKIGFLRKYNFFSRNATMMAMLMLMPVAATAAMPEPKPLPDNSTRHERRFIAEGNKQFDQGHLREAEISYRRALDENPQSEIARYNEALTRLKIGAETKEQNAELLKAATETMTELMQNAENPQVAEFATYNLGNIAVESQQLQQALQLYRQALRINPSNMQTRENYRYV